MCIDQGKTHRQRYDAGHENERLALHHLARHRAHTRWIKEHHKSHQERNRADARDRLKDMIEKAAAPPPPKRKKTRPSRGAVERRLKSKAVRSNIKKMRGSVERD